MEQPSVTYSATQSIDYLGQTHNRADQETLNYSSQYQETDIYSEQQEQCLTNVTQTRSSYVPRYNRSLQNRKIQRKIRHAKDANTLNYLIQLPRQITNNPFADQIFNGANFY
ncbi:hypothetical protein RhiirA1_474858 [Rhizophagus irregularis]|uniref:Uncharacterized protein n=1 Tax=Rhizophagus irregularis TaxID=588596 RepID=A0A2I1ES21_9GLOM|nr:hypothetical protein RhiirA1_474858 [Rhizophagus irregularis]PKY24928.1 hypothetical protein RhiirB3_439671 [Rhizophagus irregularis]CAB4493738.1 unnamed protein product [Rhizophagus irregularis]CAB5371600.1 unnamed protein product [Rhizophagus irregularis]